MQHNSPVIAERWTRFLAERVEFPAGAALMEQFGAGRIKRLCLCGCNTYEFEPAEDATLLTNPSTSGGSIFELNFHLNDDEGSLELIVLVDKRGRLAGIEVDYSANSSPVPARLDLREPPYYVYVSPSLKVA